MVTCPICGSNDYLEIYHGTIRAGSFGKMTNEINIIIECKTCKLARLKDFVVGQKEYESSEYRESYNDSSHDDVLLSMHDHEQPSRLNIIGLDQFRDKIILDYGAGHGSFLDSIKGVAKETIAIEPFQGMHKSLKDRGHKVFSYASDALVAYKNKIDIIVSFGVIEHVMEPDVYLQEANVLLSKEGTIILQTDNSDDVLVRTKAKNFDSFFYRTAHNWYFSPVNLKQLFEKIGFEKVELTTKHNYDFSNFLLWHREGKPTGNGKEILFNKSFDQIWKSFLEENLLGELITIVARK